MITILDVSSFQGPDVDFGKVKASGIVDAAYVKLTEGASGEGSTDEYGTANLQRGRAAGLPMGAYHFLSALSAPDAQAQHFLQTLDAAGGCDLPVMLDLESMANGKLAPAPWVQIWMDIVEKALGKIPLLYTGAWVAALEHLASCPQYARYPGWVAAYTAAAAPPLCAPWGAWNTPTGPALWQYTAKAMIAGVPNPCDLSRAWLLPGADAAPSSSASAADAAAPCPDTQPSTPSAATPSAATPSAATPSAATP